MSRFEPTVEECRALVVTANNRAERLARRIVYASRAVKNGAPAEAVLAILDGNADDSRSLATTDNGGTK